MYIETTQEAFSTKNCIIINSSQKLTTFIERLQAGQDVHFHIPDNFHFEKGLFNNAIKVLLKHRDPKIRRAAEITALERL